MKIEIWSDVMCPFCYIGKRHLEKALTELPFGNEMVVVWKSYQLNPDYKNTTNEDFYTYLSRSKGMNLEDTKQLTQQVVSMASNAGLDIDFESNIPANSFNAHRLTHFAATKDMQHAAEEAIFKAHFTDGKNVDDLDVLLNIAADLGLALEETKAMLESDAFEADVRKDIYESQQIGVKGVPFFLIDQKYTFSGAQPVEVFKQALTQGYSEWKVAQE